MSKNVIIDLCKNISVLFFVADGMMYWQEKQDTHKPNDNPWLLPYYRPRSADIEITAYALLAYSNEKDFNVGLSISRWLSQQRNSLGGYSSTQVHHNAILFVKQHIVI